jgi:hypothetical protein
MALTEADISVVVKAAKKLAIDAPEVSVESFYGSELNLSPVQLAAAFPDPDPGGEVAIAVSHLSLAREQMLRDKCEVAEFVVYSGVNGNSVISGLCTYLSRMQLSGSYPSDFLERIKKHKNIRATLLNIDKGHDLEVVAAAILSEACFFGAATKGSGDQGVDAIAWNHLVDIEEAFSHGAVGGGLVRAGQKVMIVASSKAAIDSNFDNPKVINPAHIRELIGGWLIQRSESGNWREFGIQMLTPLQLVLVTTYRLSPASKDECQKLGVQVWGIAELIYLICKYAPSSVFQRGGKFVFSPAKFNEWWHAKSHSRVSP